MDTRKRAFARCPVSGARRGMQLKALLSLGLLAGVGAVSTLAAWTGGARATSEIGAGTVAIGVVDSDGSVQASYPMPIDGANWYPGLNRAVAVTIKNTGTLDAPYSVSGSVTEAGVGKLGAGLNVKVTGGPTAADGTCNGEVVLTKAADSGFPAPSLPHQLKAGAAQPLCVQYSLPTTAPSSLQGSSTTITLTFTATVGVS